MVGLQGGGGGERMARREAVGGGGWRLEGVRWRRKVGEWEARRWYSEVD